MPIVPYFFENEKDLQCMDYATERQENTKEMGQLLNLVNLLNYLLCYI